MFEPAKRLQVGIASGSRHRADLALLPCDTGESLQQLEYPTKVDQPQAKLLAASPAEQHCFRQQAQSRIGSAAMQHW